MAFDNDTRNKLANLVGKCRALLTDEFLRQCQSTFGIQPDGLMISLEDLGRLSDDQLDVARQLRDRIDYLAHNEEADNSIPNSIDKMLREQAFTVLNRLAAMKMAEARGLIIESVSKGQESEGFQMYDMIGGSAMGDKFARYVCYLRSMFDEIAVDLGSLFDRFSPFGLLFPNEDAFGGLLELLNQKELEHLWAEDETIGWIYQYWNSEKERKEMKAAVNNGPPRNSRELAVRNQFFTPRYVVEFLTDNTLGRIWYEMTRGETRLADQCKYLVRRPTEIFLKDGEEAPQQPEQEGHSQEELLKQPVYIQHRSFKDPREIRLLDPACGSMHFGLYAFDLFEAIYEEGWEKSIGTLKQDFPDKTEFLAQVPRLIIENNIHGVDIDPRAVQIAGLSLWLRAQRSWKNQSVQPGDRPQIRKSNIVCAEPMPGDEAMLEEFLETLDPPLLRDLVRKVFDKMKLAGEAGTLLKIEEEIRFAIQDARNAAHAMRDDLFSQEDAESEDFFNSAEERIYESLQNYAESAESRDYQRRLFAEDAAHGFAFIDLCRKRYDVVVMNPPFGELAKHSLNYLRNNYNYLCDNLYCGFIERASLFLLQKGSCGSITDRSYLVKQSYEDLRVWLIENNLPSFVVDLGWGVLDAANVETCAAIFSIGKNCSKASFQNLGGFAQPQSEELLQLCSGKKNWITDELTTFANLPFASLAYSMPSWMRQGYTSHGNKITNSLCSAWRGMAGSDAERLYRSTTEISPSIVGKNKRWIPLQKGSPYTPYYYAPEYLLLHEQGTFASVLSFGSGRITNSEKYYHSGISFGKRTDRMYAFPMHADEVFSVEGQAIFPLDKVSIWQCLAVLNSSAFQEALNSICGQHKLHGYINAVHFSSGEIPDCSKLAKSIWLQLREIDKANELSQIFICPIFSTQNCIDDDDFFQLCKLSDRIKIIDNCKKKHSEINKLVLNAISAPEDLAEIGVEHSFINNLFGYEGTLVDEVGSFLSWILGCNYGRWDIRYANIEHQAPELPDPFDPLPVCPPGMLQNADGLPASESEIPDDYSLRISWPGILVDDEGHPEDIITRVREALSVIWKDNSSSIEQEACEILKVKSLRDYFAEKKSGGKFFKDHLKRYSKSRRKAPIYWPLSTESGSYTLWIYYHRLTDQTLYQCVSDYIEPKIEQCEKDLQILNQQFELGQADGKTNDQISELKTLINELKNFRDELLNVAKLPYKPNLNDGVQITAAPLWKCFRLGAWQKTLKDTWKKLEKGDYDWAHLSYSIWPERVKDKCIKDKSLAIAHGLEDVYIEPPAKAKKAKKASTEALDLE